MCNGTPARVSWTIGSSTPSCCNMTGTVLSTCMPRTASWSSCSNLSCVSLLFVLLSFRCCVAAASSLPRLSLYSFTLTVYNFSLPAYQKILHSVIWVGLLARKTLCMQSSFAGLMLRHLYLCSVIMPKAERVFVKPAGNRNILGVCIHVLRRPILGMTWVDAGVMTVKPSVCTRIWLMHSISVVYSRIVVRFAFWKWQGTCMITATRMLLTITKTVTLVVFALPKKTSSFCLWVLNRATNYYLALPTWLSSAMPLTLNCLSTKSSWYLLRHYYMLLVDDWRLHIDILKLGVLSSRALSRKEFLLVCISSMCFNLTSLWCWTLRFCEVLCSLKRFWPMSSLDFNFIGMSFLGSDRALLLQ